MRSFFISAFFFFEIRFLRDSSCGPGWPETQSRPPASAPQVLGSKICATVPGFYLRN